MNLPPALAPWAAELSVFPADIAEGLGPMILRLSAAIGPIAAPAGHGTGDPDGYADLGTRGNYDRLAASEWMLASEFPEEFDRRAAMNEHLFWQLARKEPHRSRACRVLFDAGPSQVGGPRLAHIAALVLMIRRARAAGAGFAWGIAQDEARSLLEGLSEAEFWTLLNRRTQREPDERDIADWAHRLDAEEVWIVGGSRSIALANQGWSTIEIVEPFDVTRRQLDVTVRCAQFQRTLTLELPTPETCLRVLRDPFHIRPEPKSARVTQDGVAPASNLVFDHLGTNLFGLSQTGRLLIYSLMHPKRLYRTRLTVHRIGDEPLVAAGRVGRTLFGVHRGKSDIAVIAYQNGRSTMEGRFDRRFAHMFAGRDLLPCAPANDSTLMIIARQFGVMFVVKRGRMPERREATSPEVNALDIANIRNRAYSLQTNRAHSRVELLPWGAPRPAASWQADKAVVKAYFGYDPKAVLLGFGETDGRWVIQAAGEAKPRSVLQAGELDVIGVMQLSPDSDPGVLAVQPDRRGILFVKRGGYEPLLSTPGLIERAVFSYAKPRLAVTLKNGDILVYSLPSPEPLFHFVSQVKA